MKPTVDNAFDAIRKHCLKCDGAKKLVSSHCTNNKCDLFPFRKYRLERCQQMTIFTFDAFKEFCNKFLKDNYYNMMQQMWWSDIRIIIESMLKKERIQFSSNWWSAIAQEILPPIGWRIDGATRTSPINRARENRYSKCGTNLTKIVPHI
jgi:hypothetical protein